MRWVIESAVKPGVSSCGWRRSVKSKKSAMLLWQDEKSIEFHDLGAVAQTWGFAWKLSESPATVQFFPDSPLRDSLAELNFEGILGAILADIARVVGKKGCKMPSQLNTRGARWPLKGGTLKIYHLRPTRLDDEGHPAGFSRLGFLLLDPGQKEGEAKHFYQWSMLRKDDTNLDINKPIAEWNISGVEQVHNKVWILRNALGHKGVLKYESSDKVERFYCIGFLAANLFEDTISAVLAKPEDIEAIQVARVPNGKRYVPSDPRDPPVDLDSYPQLLSDLTKNRNATNMLVCKLEFREIQDNLNVLIVDATQGKSIATKRKLQVVHQKLFTPKNCKMLGRIALFDMLTGNTDRIQSVYFDEKLGMKLNNIDFDATGLPIALDNFDPNGHVNTDVWPNELIILNQASLDKYARDFLNELAELTHGAAYIEATRLRQSLELAFIDGIKAGKAILVEFLKPHGRSLQEKWGKIGVEYHRRAVKLRDQCTWL